MTKQKKIFLKLYQAYLHILDENSVYQNVVFCQL